MGSAIDFGASLCFSDAVYRPVIRRQVVALLKQAGPDADQHLQTFLDANQYKTTAGAVRAAFEAWKSERPKITPLAVRFAAEFLTNSNLRTAWIGAAQALAASAPSQGRSAATPGQADPALAGLAKVLTDYGYATLSPEDAVVAQANLMDDAATIWAGTYETTVTPRQDHVDIQHQSPALLVSSDHIKLGLMSLIGAAFAEDDLTLSWVQDPPGPVGLNTTSGSLVFSTRGDGSRVFAGTLTYSTKGRDPYAWDPGAYDFKGVAPPPPLAPPAAGGDGSSDSDTTAIVGLVIGLVGMVAGVVGAYFAYRQWRQAEAAADPNGNPPEDPPRDPPSDPPSDPPQDDPLSEPDSPVSRRLSDASDISDDVVQRIEPPLSPDVISRVAPLSVVELSQTISAPPNSPVSGQLDSQASAAADDLNLDDEFENDPEPTPEPTPEPVDPVA